MFIYLSVGCIFIVKAVSSLLYKTCTSLGMVWPYTYETAIDCLFAIAEYMLEIYLVLFTLSCVSSVMCYFGFLAFQRSISSFSFIVSYPLLRYKCIITECVGRYALLFLFGCRETCMSLHDWTVRVGQHVLVVYSFSLKHYYCHAYVDVFAQWEFSSC